MTNAAKMRDLMAGGLGLTLLALTQLGEAAPLTLDLANYTHTATHFLPTPAAEEASAVTWNWDTGNLFVLGDEGDALVEVSTTGQLVSVMSLTGFDDTEGLTYVGNGEFVLTEERLRDAYRLTYAAGGNATRASLPSADLGPTTTNIGIEGISFDPRDGRFVTVKESNPQQVNINTLVFGAPGTLVGSLFTPALGVLDLSDVQVLAASPAFLGGADEDHLLIFSQESALLLEVDRSGNILGSFDFTPFADDAEGVTVDGAGNLYLVAENGSQPLLFVLSPTPVPAPPAVWLGASGLAALWRWRRRQR